MSDSFKWCQVPGSKVVDAYCKLAEERELHEEGTEIRARFDARMLGFREAVGLYCPDEPGYTCTSGFLIMAADEYMMAKEDAPCEHCDPGHPGRSYNNGDPTSGQWRERDCYVVGRETRRAAPAPDAAQGGVK